MTLQRPIPQATSGIKQSGENTRRRIIAGLCDLSWSNCCKSVCFVFCLLLADPFIVQPCQSLFVAPCSHTWHYKCIRIIINGPHWPHFICPNCRSVADLEAELDEPSAIAEDTTNGVEGGGSNEVNHGVGLSGQEYDELMQRLEGESQEIKEAVLQATTRRLAHEPLEEVEAAALESARRRQKSRSTDDTAVPNASENNPNEPDLEIGDSNEDSEPEHGEFQCRCGALTC
jgi:hypothetical protein